MAIRKTIQTGSPVLRLPATPVAQAGETSKSVEKCNDSQIQQIIIDLVDTMRSADLVGMAAPQIGESLQIFVIEIRKTELRTDVSEFKPLSIYINPEIVSVSREKEHGWEGCGSVENGGLFGRLVRFTELTISYIDEKGNKQEKTCSGLLARVIQHEMDHIDGILFTDHVDSEKLINREAYQQILKNR